MTTKAKGNPLFPAYRPDNFVSPYTNERQYPTEQAPQLVTVSLSVPDAHAPALWSAIEEISNEIGGRLEGQHEYDVEESLTRSAAALGVLRAALSQGMRNEGITVDGDPNYKGRR